MACILSPSKLKHGFFLFSKSVWRPIENGSATHQLGTTALDKQDLCTGRILGFIGGYFLYLIADPACLLKILLPLVNQYFKNHCLYFLSTPAKVLGSGGHSSNKEKEMIARWVKQEPVWESRLFLALCLELLPFSILWGNVCPLRPCPSISLLLCNIC